MKTTINSTKMNGSNLNLATSKTIANDEKKAFKPIYCRDCGTNHLVGDNGLCQSCAVVATVLYL